MYVFNKTVIHKEARGIELYSTSVLVPIPNTDISIWAPPHITTTLSQLLKSKVSDGGRLQRSVTEVGDGGRRSVVKVYWKPLNTT